MEASSHSIFAVLEAAERIRSRVETGLEEVGLSSAKFAGLNVLARAEAPLPLSELANRLSCVRSNVTQLVDRLEAEGLVRRVNDPADRRSVLAELTEAGAERQASGARVIASVHEELAARVEPAERAVLFRVLSNL